MLNRFAVALLGLALVTTACSKPEPITMVAIDMSNKVDAGNRVYSPGQIFAPASTMYASISTQGTGTAKLAAKWMDPTGKVIAEQTQDIAPTKTDGPSYWEFHITPPAEGWPVGIYKAEFTIDGGGKRSRDLEVRITQ